jgi:hypothetical protein
MTMIKVYVVVKGIYIKGVFSSEFRAYRFIEEFGSFEDHHISVYFLNGTECLREIIF